MQIEEKIYLKFPVILRNKLLSKEIELPDATLIHYKPILVYRAVERKKDDRKPVSSEDFKSYFELNKAPKKARGVKENFERDPHYYGVSSFLDRKIVEQIMKFPNPKKKMAVGYVYEEGGPQETNKQTQHVCWWLFENVDIVGFRLEED